MMHEIYCLRCPRGCLLQVEMNGDVLISVKGNSCRMGEEFAIQEVNDPRRLFTSLVRVTGGKTPLVPVVTSAPVPRREIFEWAKLCRKLVVRAPVRVEEIVAQNPFGNGIDLVTTWFVEEENVCH
ncbi:DUF1667 domain-containing protein [Thermospira aquatica]|uniref:DUF1667 domain-containing protein n=1 Tax=Thermospira aquatica TaxID=2828656 RepID=A0AAX3BEG4_9SPIR|nr:DUF1667 domain-containing protein [Thermospira aquatica]URA10503.1 DUF1667 domain-containing protein [Thermospira aquatica]